MALPLFAAPAGTLPFRVANLATFLEDRDSCRIREGRGRTGPPSPNEKTTNEKTCPAQAVGASAATSW
jgi:hypothetical protein